MPTLPGLPDVPRPAARPADDGAFPDPVRVSPATPPGTRGSAARRAPRPAVAAAVAAGALLLAPLAAATPAAAEGDSATAKPPARMSTLGGAQLGKQGTQVRLGKDAPALPKDLSALSWIVSDEKSGEVLAAHNAHWQLPPASTLKMLFADTLVPKFEADRSYTVKPQDLAGMGEGSSLVGIKENLSYTVRDLWLGVFLRSGNDAVHTLAAMNHGVDATVAEMRQKAKQLNALDTHVVTPDGYDAKGQVSSAYDLSLFARQGLKNADFRAYCATASAQFPGDKGKHGKRETFGIQNTDRLLTGDYDLAPYKGIEGVKNGYTTNAGNTYTGAARRGDRTLLVTVMNPQRRVHNEVYREAAKLLDWGFSAAPRVSPVGQLVDPGDQAAKASDGKNTAKTSADDSGHTTAAAASGGGGWTAAGIAAGAVVVVGAAGYAFRRSRSRARG
ncbi:D-alanyl-D-alanine carboxypeptidase family protein [Streptomyces sp. NPDC059740]|uniref:D-alanyl-D-alanine carboxypeptidase family protein n=1 Tax=Streptomyces sp. NPDC059740 TaxID=3346926 RepID=UPI0036504CFE